MKRINWKLIFKIIITIATAILGMLNSQEKLPYNENWRASREDHWTGRIERWNVRLRLVTNVLLLLAAIVAILSCSRILWKAVLQQSRFKNRPEIMQSQPATVGFAFGWWIKGLLLLQRGRIGQQNGSGTIGFMETICWKKVSFLDLLQIFHTYFLVSSGWMLIFAHKIVSYNTFYSILIGCWVMRFFIFTTRFWIGTPRHCWLWMAIILRFGTILCGCIAASGLGCRYMPVWLMWCFAAFLWK